MCGFLSLASMLALASGQASRALFSTPTMYTSPMAAPAISAYGAPVAANVQTAPYYFQPVASASVAERGQPGQSFAPKFAVFATSAAVAMLAVRGTTRKPVKKATRKPVKRAQFSRGSVKPTATTSRRVYGESNWPGKSTELTGAGDAVATLLSAPFRLVKAFFSEDNWLIQAFNLVASLPERSNEKVKSGKDTNQIRGG